MYGQPTTEKKEYDKAMLSHFNEQCASCGNAARLRTWYEYPCYGCTRNPHTPDEIIATHIEDIKKPRIDRFTKD